MRKGLHAALALLIAMAVPRAVAQASEAYVHQLMDRGNYREAAAALDDIEARTTAADPAIYRMLIRAYLHLNQADKALGACERGMRAQPSAGLENAYVALLRNTRPRDQVEKTLIDALNANPQSPVFQKAVARMLYEDNPQDERAGAMLASAARLIPDDAEVHFFFGQWLCLNQREPACIQELNTAIAKTDGDNPDAMAQIWSMLATAHANMGQYEEAGAAWEQARRANGSLKQPSAWLDVQYAQYLRQLGRLDEADSSLRKVLRRYPDFEPAHFEAAEVALRRNDAETATREAGRALACPGVDHRERQNIHYFLSTLYAHTGRYADADRERALARE
jgi:predicted Zn-dependent protease